MRVTVKFCHDIMIDNKTQQNVLKDVFMEKEGDFYTFNSNKLPRKIYVPIQNIASFLKEE